MKIDISNNIYNDISNNILNDISNCIIYDLSNIKLNNNDGICHNFINNKYLAYKHKNNNSNNINKQHDININNKMEHSIKTYNNNNNFEQVLKRIENEYNLISNNKHNRFLIKNNNEYKPINIIKKKVIINEPINNIQDILNMIEKYPLSNDIQYNINMHDIHNIKEPLSKLNNMIGMDELKQSILDQLLYYIQNLHLSYDNKVQDYMHTVIYGPPGTGKTEVAKIIGNIFSKLKILPNNKFKKVTRTDLIAGYLGQTSIKTSKVIKECIGGVLFIDEVYALGNSEKKDSFSKECIDTLCEALSDHKDNLMVIIAGYKDEIKNCFFNYNKGLESRFIWKFETEKYDYNALFLIFKKQVSDIKWNIDDSIKPYWFYNKINDFKYYGRDIENLLSKIKIAHSRRVFCLPDNMKKLINLNDMDNGYTLFINNTDKQKNNDDINFLFL